MKIYVIFNLYQINLGALMSEIELDLTNLKNSIDKLKKVLKHIII